MAMKDSVRWLLRIPVPWVFVLGYLLGASLEHLVGPMLSLQVPQVVTHAVGCALFTSGALIAGWALAIFHHVKTTTVPGQASNKLVESGPYRFTRNPMYVGLALCYLGEAALLRQLGPLPLLLLVLAYVQRIVIPLEESRLWEVFGEEYTSYRGRVRRWI